ncbi:MAG: type IX secretion system membrane protein PorP/SprF [Bacteroidetes bacterium]|nr:MAG: type IX secretion system membrane protein PorP/SprF [Bacteroidota bacterium]
MKKQIIITVIAFIANCLLANCFSQDIHFSQYWMTPLLLNPAQAGSEHDMRGIINYKNQWNSVAEPYSTANLSWDMKLGAKKSKKGFSAAGVNIFHDKAGDAQMKTLQGNLAYAYHVYLNQQSTLGAALYGGFAQRSINYAGLQWMNQYDGASYNSALPSGEPTGSTSMSYLDLGSGVHYEYGKEGNTNLDLSAGFSLFHINQPKYSFYGTNEKLYMKETGYVHAVIGSKNSKLAFWPGLVYTQQGKNSELLLGSLFRYTLKEDSKFTGYVKGSSFSLGAYYRNKDALIAAMLFQFGQYSLGLSYDVNVSGLKTASNGKGGFEISLRFVNPNPFLFKSAARFN